jgi:subtilisin family serine protease
VSKARPRTGSAHTSVALLATAALVGGSATALVTGPAQADPAPKVRAGKAEQQLGKKDRSLLAEARANGEKRVTLIVAAAPGRSQELAAQLRQLGGEVRKSETSLDYLRVSMPIGRADKAADLRDVAAMDVSEVIPIEDPRPGPNGKGEDGAVIPTPSAPPSRDTPRLNPYMPTGDTGAAQFALANPKADGRGVTIGILDTGVDLSHPALAKTSTGERKITDWTTYTDPNTDNDPTWLKMSTGVFSAGKTFDFGGRTWTAPAKGGPFSAALFSESGNDISDAASEVGGDVNRDGDKTDTWGVIQDKVSKAVYVDTDQDGKFTDSKPMTDYKYKYDVGTFGTDNVGTAIRESMPFVVQTNIQGWVNIGIVSGAHGSHVAGITAANGMFGGKMAGAAPGAKLKSFRVCLFSPGCTSYALIEGMTAAAKSGVDVINMSIGGLPALNDGNNARAELYNRLIDEYNVQLVISAGNSGAGLNTIGDPSVASKVLSVGSYIHNNTWKSNYGSSSPQTDNLHPYSSRGPREDGGFKPEVVAPGSAISTIPTWQPGGPVVGVHELPPGYAMFNGTSMAAPQAAGAAALLVSAYKGAHRGVRPKASALRASMISTARYLPQYGAYEQGLGLIRVDRAWSLLNRAGGTDTVDSSVEVSTALSPNLGTPNRGTGIYDREGVKAGTSYTRTYTLKRTTGASGAVAYNATWVGNDGTFASPKSVVLTRGVTRSFTVTVAPKTAGIHSAVLRLDNPKTPNFDALTLNTVVAADQFTAGNGYSVTKTGSIGRNQAKSFFFAVPAGTPAFKVDMEAGGDPGKGQVRFLRFHPYGVGIESNSTPNCYNPPAGGTCPGSPTSRTVANPFAGVWEVVVEARRTSDVLSAPFSVTASVLGATVAPNPDTIATAVQGTAVDREYTLTTKFGAFTGRAVGTPLGSAKIDRPSIAQDEQQVYDVNVGAGATSLRATIGRTGDTGADLDLAVFDCTSGDCVAAGSSADGDSEESVTLPNPAEGLWKVVVDGFEVPAGSTQFDYVDVYSAPAHGAVAVTDADAPRAAGSTWTVPGTVTAGAAPGAGRVLFGQVLVKTDDDLTVGTGDVVVQAVTPAP